MRGLVVAVALLTVGTMAQVPLAPVPTAEEVLQFLQGMPISAALKAALAPVLGAGLATGRATPAVSLPFLRGLATLPPPQAEEALSIVYRTLERGFMVDALMNDVLKVLKMGQPWEAVMTNLRIRANLLVASQQVLVQHGIVGVGPQGPGGPLLPQDRLVVEMAWAVGDFVLSQPREPLEAFVRSRFQKLRGSVLDPSLVDPLLAALTPELVEQIARQAYGPSL
ncbi:MAG: hypothetical protein KA136_00525 [Candidatus Bipolaricaulis sp.]|uniref:Uncharacterized protein n=1 Tax=Candidatus Bipolaricaulis anaerobius TaxID=2026885 RepID=A0A2X3KXA4_9BACT|nr:hypothetical protein [Candidatus Bipolaricaulis anaerobius]MBP7725841.1 hypothetical protein [Candidatus Bipolaricaulis sp.]MDD2912300.1 hypothetical protein [Candidatus Bipolaricaulis anaerobius]SQD93228.1 protein of unknown function [Candidatus Bipolaricaulis anaerobius]HOD73471.1 hypothetical protein [Candidatus Bipolaricaulis anaerobius]HQM37719.1 hypothetical protein [Candidatus Bipolaricaulis anaerobius]